MVVSNLEGVDKECRLSFGNFSKWQIIACLTRASSFGGPPGCLMGCKRCFGYLACRWRMMITADLGILKWWTISLWYWLDLCNSRIAKMISNKYSRLELLGLESRIKFDVLRVEKFAVEHFTIFCLSLGKRCRSMIAYTRFVQVDDLMTKRPGIFGVTGEEY